MTRWRATQAVWLALMALVVVTSLSASSAQAANPSVDRVLVISYPRLRWADVLAAQPPVLMNVLGRSTVASMSVRTADPVTTLADGYATMGAGNRASIPASVAQLVIDTATQDPPVIPPPSVNTPNVGAVLSRKEAQRSNDKRHYDTALGALGSALMEGGKGPMAAVANADSTDLDGLSQRDRSAAWAAMDRSGAVLAGSLAPDLSNEAPAAAGLRRVNPDQVVAHLRDAWSRSSVALVEMSDLERVDEQRHLTGVSSMVGALRESDGLLQQLLSTVDAEHTLVLMVSPAAPGDGPELTFFAASGPGMRSGLASSGTTRRPGYVTLPDIAPTIVDALGVKTPHEMNGTPIKASGSRQLDHARLKWLADRNTVAKFRDRAVGPVSVVFVAGQVVVYLLGAWVLVGGQRRRRLRPAIEFSALVVLATPLVAFLSGVVRYDYLGIVGYTVTVTVLALLLAAAVWPLRYLHGAIPPLVLIGGNLLLQLVDIASGGHLQIDTVFGYSPIVAGRFQGFGNLSFAIVAGSAIVLATAPLAIGLRGRAVWWYASGILALAVVADGAPFWGSDVGGALALAPAAVITVMLIAGRRVNARRVALALIASVLLVAGFAAIDLTRPAADRTHLGRFADRVLHGEIRDTLLRKGEANLHILTSSVWTLLIPVSIMYLVILGRRRSGSLAEVQRRVDGLRACLVGALVAAVLGFALNDSGIAIPSMMLAIVLPWVTWWAVRTSPPP